MSRRRLRKRANGEGSVYYRECDARWAAEITVGYDDRGRQVKPRVYGRTQAEARAKLDELRKRISQGLKPKPDRLTVAQFLERWLAVSGCEPHVEFKTAESYRNQVNLHIVPAIGRIELTKLGPEDVQQLINIMFTKAKRVSTKKGGVSDVTLPTQTFSPKTVKQCRDTLRTALNVAIKWNLIARNPAAAVTVKQVKRRPTIYDEKQAAIFIETIYGERLEALYWLALCLGSREGEILGLRWTDFDFELGKFQLLRSLQRVKRPGEQKSRLELVPTKTEGSDRSAWLPQIVLEKVLEHQRRQFEERKAAGSAWIETGMVFTTPKGTPLEPRSMLRDFHRIRSHPKLPRIRFHDLRHSAATILKMGGVSDQAIQHLLGHSSVRTTQEIYTHLTIDGQKQAADKMDEIFGSVAVKVAVKNAQKKPS